MTRTALVTDGDRANLELLTAVLVHEGFDVVSTSDGADALARALAQPPALLVCADNLAGAGPRDLCRQARARAGTIRIILLVPDAAMGDAPALAKAVGADAVLSTTLRHGELKNLLAGWGLVDAAARKSQPLSFTVPATVAAPLSPGPMSAADAGPSGIAIPPMPVPTPMSVPAPMPIPIPVPGASMAFEVLPDLVLEAAASRSAPRPTPPPVATPARVVSPARAPVTQPEAAVLTVPMIGTLSALPLPRLVYELYVATFSGILRLERGGLKRVVYFWAGAPVRVDTNQVSETLGRILLEHGRITTEQYTRSLEAMQAKRCKQGEALVAMGVLTNRELLDALGEQARIKLNSTFAWREAHYALELRLDFVRDTILSDVHPLQAIWRGVHEHYDLTSLLGFFEPLAARYVVATPLFAVHHDALAPLLRDSGIVEALDGRTQVAHALDGDPRPPQRAQALYVLLATDMVRAAAEPGEAAATPAKSTSPTASVLDPATLTKLADEIAHEYLRLKAADLFDALRLDFTASGVEVDLAYENIVQSLGVRNLPTGLADEVVHRAQEILAILTRARDTLRDPSSRDRYLHSEQARFAPGGPSATLEGGRDTGPAPIASLEIDVVSGLAGHNFFVNGEAYMRAGRFIDAAREFQQAIDACSTAPEYRVALGVAILKAEGMADERTRARVVTCLEQALQLDPSHTGANLEMAKLLFLTGARDRAYAYVQKVLQRAPESQEARKLLAALS